jgi:hypothetical protein
VRDRPSPPALVHPPPCRTPPGWIDIELAHPLARVDWGAPSARSSRVGYWLVQAVAGRLIRTEFWIVSLCVAGYPFVAFLLLNDRGAGGSWRR